MIRLVPSTRGLRLQVDDDVEVVFGEELRPPSDIPAKERAEYVQLAREAAEEARAVLCGENRAKTERRIVCIDEYSEWPSSQSPSEP